MLVKPNERFAEDVAPNDVENDLYRKFHRVYSEILHPDNKTYNSEMYCDTKNGIESRIIQILDNVSDGIVPILGYTGMGKTFLMHHCIRKKYHYNGLIKNKSFVVQDNEHYDLIIYASYDAARKEEVTPGRLGGKLSNACDNVLELCGIPNQSVEEKKKIFKQTVNYINENKGELLEEYAETAADTKEKQAEKLFEQDRTAYEAERLKCILTSFDTKIKNIILVLDDIEGYIGKHKNSNNEYELIDTYVSIYDCLRRYLHDKYEFNVKLFICMREHTYNEVCKTSWYTTHRAIANPYYLSSGINLSEIFLKRFEFIEKKKKVLEYVEDQASWNSAKEILTKLSKELERSMGNSILKICNYNVSDAVQLFAGILSNRQWTQRSEKVSPSFKIEEYHYYLSVASIFRAMAMRNAVIFQNLYQIPNIFYENGKMGYCLPIYILTLLRGKKNSKREFTLNKIEVSIIEVLHLEESRQVEKKKKDIQEIMEYFLDKELVFEKICTDRNTDGFISKFYLSPKGENILEYFLRNTILLEIYRDDLYLDSANHEIRCSDKLNRVELFRDIIKIIDKIGEEEKEFIGTISTYNTWDEFYSVWEKENITLKLIGALRVTFAIYYKDEIPTELTDLWWKLKRKYEKIFNDK